jgi:hypothetical protein
MEYANEGEAFQDANKLDSITAQFEPILAKMQPGTDFRVIVNGMKDGNPDAADKLVKWLLWYCEQQKRLSGDISKWDATINEIKGIAENLIPYMRDRLIRRQQVQPRQLQRSQQVQPQQQQQQQQQQQVPTSGQWAQVIDVVMIGSEAEYIRGVPMKAKGEGIGWGNLYQSGKYKARDTNVQHPGVFVTATQEGTKIEIIVIPTIDDQPQIGRPGRKGRVNITAQILYKAVSSPQVDALFRADPIGTSKLVWDAIKTKLPVNSKRQQGIIDMMISRVNPKYFTMFSEPIEQTK